MTRGGPPFSLALQREGVGRDLLLRTQGGSSFPCHSLVVSLACPWLRHLLLQPAGGGQVVCLGHGFTDRDVGDFLDAVYLVKHPAKPPALLEYLWREAAVVVTEKGDRNDDPDRDEFSDDESEEGDSSDQDEVKFEEVGACEKLDLEIKEEAESSITNRHHIDHPQKKKAKLEKQSTSPPKYLPTCSYCGVQNKQMSRHVATVHPDKVDEYGAFSRRSSGHGPRIWPKKCEFCEKRLASKWHYEKHLKTHSKHLVAEGDLFCDKCGEGPFLAKSLLSAHIESHKKDLPCPEDGCNATLNGQVKLREHLLFEHKIIKKRERGIHTGQHLCLYCGKKFTTESYLKHHVKHVHGEGKDKYVCQVCGKKCLTKTAHRNHGALHLPPTIPCPECTKCFHTMTYLKKHISSQHTPDDQKEYQCSVCPKGFMTKDALEGHMNWHLNLKPYQCTLCANSYADRSNCLAHERKSHPEKIKKENRTIQVKS